MISDEQVNVLLKIGRHRPRINIEEVVKRRGEDPARFVRPFMRIWDDPRYQTHAENPAGPGVTPPRAPPASAWLFFLEAEVHMAWKRMRAHMPELPEPSSAPPEQMHPAIETAQFEMAANRMRDTWTYGEVTPELAQEMCDYVSERSAFERTARRLSPILCCLSMRDWSTADEDGDPRVTPQKYDYYRLFFAFPILCIGPFLEMMMRGDSRALVLLYHFYRAARLMLRGPEAWWAKERSHVLEKRILQELQSRGIGTCLREDLAEQQSQRQTAAATPSSSGMGCTCLGELGSQLQMGD